jgi:hypothetical protein
VDANRAIHIFVALSQCLHRRRIAGADTDAQKMTNATLPRSCQCEIERTLMRSEIETIEVTVGIDQHFEQPTRKQ